MKSNCAAFVALLLLLTHSVDLGDAKRALGGSNRKTSSSGGGYSTRRQPSNPSNTGHVTPTYQHNTNSANSHADAAKLSYPNYNSQPNRPASAGTGAASGQPGAAPIGWNVPNKQGPPPAYSASNPAGGARTNMHEAPPAYGAPPSYGAATSNVHSPISATHQQGVQSGYPQSGYPQQSYHAPGGVPPGSNYYQPGHLPAGATYYPSAGHAPAPAYYPSAGHMPAGATYIPAGASLPAGATYYSQPPQQSSSGLGFGSGLAAGAIGGALLGHALTPTQTRVVEAAPAAGGGGGGGDRVIIINNGQPVEATQLANGTTVINPVAPAAAVAGAGAPVPAAAPAPAADVPAQLAPLAAPGVPLNATSSEAGGPPAPAPGAEQPPPGGIICVPVRVNETDPADNTKMVEIEKVACYPAPPAAPAGADAATASPVAADAAAPLAPMNPVPGQNSQQLQQNPTQGTLLPEHSEVKAVGSGAPQSFFPQFNLLVGSTLLGLLLACGKHFY